MDIATLPKVMWRAELGFEFIVSGSIARMHNDSTVACQVI